MSLLTNLNTLRIGSLSTWNTYWYESGNTYSYLLLQDIFVHEYINGIYVGLYMPSSIAVIREIGNKHILIKLQAHIIQKKFNYFLSFTNKKNHMLWFIESLIIKVEFLLNIFFNYSHYTMQNNIQKRKHLLINYNKYLKTNVLRWLDKSVFMSNELINSNKALKIPVCSTNDDYEMLFIKNQKFFGNSVIFRFFNIIKEKTYFSSFKNNIINMYLFSKDNKRNIMLKTKLFRKIFSRNKYAIKMKQVLFPKTIYVNRWRILLKYSNILKYRKILSKKKKILFRHKLSYLKKFSRRTKKIESI